MRLVKVQREILENLLAEYAQHGIAQKPVTVSPNIGKVREGGFSKAYSTYCIKMEQLVEAGLIARRPYSLHYAYLVPAKIEEIKLLLA